MAKLEQEESIPTNHIPTKNENSQTEQEIADYRSKNLGIEENICPNQMGHKFEMICIK